MAIAEFTKVREFVKYSLVTPSFDSRETFPLDHNGRIMLEIKVSPSVRDELDGVDDFPAKPACRGDRGGRWPLDMLPYTLNHTELRLYVRDGFVKCGYR